MYLLLITAGLVTSYFGISYLLSYFFEQRRPQFGRRTVMSLVVISAASLLGYIIVLNIPNPELANRILHGYGGGFLAFLVCFLSVQDCKIKLTTFQFIVMSVLIVTALGVMNEILEFILQNYFALNFSDTINDTWFDLVSNSAGILAAVILLVPFLKLTSNSPTSAATRR